jgi:hypothetical protein
MQAGLAGASPGQYRLAAWGGRLVGPRAARCGALRSGALPTLSLLLWLAMVLAGRWIGFL